MIVEFEKAIGKRLTHLVKGTMGRPWLFVFEEGVVCQMGLDRGWEYGDEEFEEDLEFDASYYKHEDLLAAGVIDQEWIRQQEQAKAEQKRQAAASRERSERETYERLKRKFESR